MKIRKRIIAATFLILMCIFQIANACPQPPPVDITSHNTNDLAIAGGEITLTCTGGSGTPTWSGDGIFVPTTGTSVQWTAPTTLNSNSSAGFADAVVTVTTNNSSKTITLQLQKIIYVDKDASSGGDGTTWASAFNDLQDALDLANTNGATDIWVAEGTYKPGTSRTSTFQLIEDVSIYGGFNGTETSPGQRTPNNETILSGDIGTVGTATDNCYHVVTGAANATLNGFIIKDGYSENASAGLTSYGAGMLNYIDADSILISCTFADNHARFGGGLYNVKSEAKVINCLFNNNKAKYDGGGLREVDGTSILTNCTFYDNEADTGNSGYCGGGMANWDSTSTITNCIFWANSDNSGVDESAQIHVYGDNVPVPGPCVNYSCIEDFSTLGGTGNTANDPCFVNSSDPDGSDNIFMTTDDGLILDSNESACIDAGDNYAPSIHYKDILDRPRFIDDPNTPDSGNGYDPNDPNADAIVDMGAYEFCGPNNTSPPVRPVHFTGAIMAGEFKYSHWSKAFENDMYSNILAPESYPSTAVAISKAIEATLDGIAIHEGTRLIIYPQINYGGTPTLVVDGPVVINNAIWKNDSRYNVVMTMDWPEPLQTEFPPNVRFWSDNVSLNVIGSTNMHSSNWISGSLKIEATP